IAQRLLAALGTATNVLNVGAGAGSYEPRDRRVVAVEPSAAMVAQRPPAGAPGGRAGAGPLPVPHDTLDAAMALLTVHHWPDAGSGLAEVRRVTRGPVAVFTFDQAVHLQQWLVTDYFPEMAGLDTDVPSPDEIARALGGGTVEILPVPFDCTDGF